MKTMLAAAIAVLVATPLLAQGTAPAAKVGATPATSAHPVPAAPARHPPAHPTALTGRTAPAPHGRMVTTTIAGGRKVTYDCGKKGNAAKKACRT